MAASAALGVTLALFYSLRLQTVSLSQHLADGSRLKIRDVVVAEELSRTFRDGNLVQRTLDRIVPDGWSSALPWPVSFWPSILRCNSMKAWSSASGRGGQPGI